MRLSTLLGDQQAAALPSRLPLAILPGEGIGPEVIEACAPIIKAIEQHSSFTFDIEYGGMIGSAAYNEFGTPLPDEVSAFCEKSFARGAPLFCGPGGHRFVYELRRQFDVFCKFVPLQPLPALEDTGALRPDAVRGSDILLVRDNAGGLYQGNWHTVNTGQQIQAHHSFSYDESQVLRIVSLAFAAAAARRGSLCVVHKPGGAPAISELWVQIAQQCARTSPVDLRFLEVDTAAYLLLADARAFDVVVAPNMFGDILADAAALLLGSRGMSYSFNLGDNGVAIYQTGHGAAYDLAGTGRANPLGQIQSLAALLRESFGLVELSRALIGACNAVLADGLRTADIMGPTSTLVSTADMGAAVALKLEQHLELQQPAIASGRGQ